MSKFELTSGRLTSLSRLLSLLAKNKEIDVESAISYLIRLQQIPTQQLGVDAIFLARTLDLIEYGGTVRNLTPSGRAIVLGPEDDFGLSLQRRLLLKIIQGIRRDLLWLTYAKPEEILTEYPSVHQILTELKLVGRNATDDAEQFWADLRAIDRKVDDALLKKIGDQAEAWSIEFEKNRLSSAGLEGLAKDVHWISRESDFHGYDILSFSGIPPSVSERRHIEVKRCRVNEYGGIDFYLSRNEFNQAQVLEAKYFFHLWWTSGSRVHLAVVPGLQIGNRVPVDFNEDNFWTECRVSIPMSELLEIFDQDASVDSGLR